MQLVIRLRRRRPDAGRISASIRRGLAWPLQRAGQLAHVVLSKAMLLSCEVALEYMLGLSYSPQARASAHLCARLYAACWWPSCFLARMQAFAACNRSVGRMWLWWQYAGSPVKFGTVIAAGNQFSPVLPCVSVGVTVNFL